SSGQIVDTGAAIEDNKVTDQGSLPNTFNGTLVTWTLVSGQGQLGSMNFDKTTGKWTYTLNGQVANSMPEGLTTKESFMVIPVDQFGKTMVDSNGQAVTVLIEIDVTGTNDAPDIQGRLNGSMKNAESSVEGQLQSGDPDQGDTHTWSLNGNNGSYGSMQLNASSGKWEYTLNKNHPDVLALGKGQSLTETFMVTVTDQHGDSSTKAITLNVTGENKAPVISGVTAGDVKEDVKGLHTAKANITDPNTGDTVEIIPKTQNGLFGQFTIDQQ
ncbi:VCBS domain-containing protein, partial [Oleiphilus sp. HI0066]